MGLGKTVQVLALLEARRVERLSWKDEHRPSLVVVPRSLIFNWKAESAKFAPKLRVLDNSVVNRVKTAEGLNDYDLVLTTYGTLLRDAASLKDVHFDYVILDEAQAVKNAASESAKAARLLKARHRLCLSGTPVQNHLGELWSLFEFLNPGMLGGATVFASTASKAPDEESRKLLARALRPFVLRRTKEQVARDLPAKQEQTIYCELEGEQKRLYAELRDHYRASLLGKIDEVGLGKAKILVLEALLRLRQAALHPGLIDKAKAADGSAKLDMLLPRILEVIDEGHKALVFSQFTGMLSIVRKALDKAKVKYEYLDGKTKDRQAKT
jgi:SNF2 family DNA or RNA helicase